MDCPNCGKELKIPDRAKAYMESYVQPCAVKTLCCGGIVECYPHVTFKADKTVKTEDDWGMEKGK